MGKTHEKLQNERLATLINEFTEGLAIDESYYRDKVLRQVTEDKIDDKTYDLLIKSALENIDEAEPDWTYVASRAYLHQLYEKAAENRGYVAELKYGDFYTL